MRALVFDLDGTLCTDESGEYKLCRPFRERIDEVNALYHIGHEIVISTARAARWRELTLEQLAGWGVLYDVLEVGVKPWGHVYVDDRATHPDQFFKGE